MEMTKYEKIFGHCLTMTNQYEHEGFKFHINIELGKLITGGHGLYRCNVITAMILGGEQFLYRAEINTDEETIGEIEKCIKVVKERLSDSRATLEIENDIIKLGFKRAAI